MPNNIMIKIKEINTLLYKNDTKKKNNNNNTKETVQSGMVPRTAAAFPRWIATAK